MFNSLGDSTMPLDANFYSPPLSPGIVSFEFDSTQDVVDLQPDVSLEFTRARTTSLSPLTGLGITCPTDQSGFLGDSELFIYDCELSYPYDSPSGQRRRFTPVDFLFDPPVTINPLEDPVIAPLRLSSVLNSTEFCKEEEPAMLDDSNDAAIEILSGSDSSMRSVRRNGSWDLQRTLETTMDTLLTEPSVASPASKDSAPRNADVDVQPADSFIVYFQQPFVPSPGAHSPLAVNPADIAVPHATLQSLFPSWPPGRETPDKTSLPLQESSSKVLADTEGSQMKLESCVERVKKEDLVSEIRFPSPAPLTKQNLRRLEKLNKVYKEEESDYDPSVSCNTSTQDYIPSPRPLKNKARTQPSRSAKRSKVNVESIEPDVFPPDKGDSSRQALSDLPINYGTPVLNAHRGISLEELKAKAARYRIRNEGRDYDKNWLMSFAGKLTPQGQLMEEFRCYIVGCSQTNKRRDHIMIHVGAHLNRRPFACEHCGARFLRKNECKRHEFSHSGLRPYKCELCLPDAFTAFVRQDLLKRHQLRTHRVGNCGTSKRPSSK